MPTSPFITLLLFSFIFIMRKPPHISHPEFSPLRHVVSPTFHPDASHHEFCARPTFYLIRMSHIRNSVPAQRSTFCRMSHIRNSVRPMFHLFLHP
uniref:Secreted protein n=1 Tax=Vitis vinifera TaxID=29760 RepID=A5AUK7_VITVI|nr:hypothetical protein VITISV_003257 [Vitis vinifera]